MTPKLTQAWQDRTKRRRMLVALAAMGVAGLLLAFALDHVVWSALYDREFRDSDKYRLLKAAGWLPAWLLMGAALILIDWPIKAVDGLGIAVRRGALLMGAATAGGAASEMLKLILRRGRPPKPPDGEWSTLYDVVGFGEKDHVLSTAGLSLPSSHSSIAFAACWMLCLLFPRAVPVWLLIAIGCGAPRVLDHAHYVSDVTASAIVGGVVAYALWAWYERLVVVWRQERADEAAAE